MPHKTWRPWASDHKPGNNRLVQCTVAITPEQRQYLEKRSKEVKRPLNALVRDALDIAIQHFEDEKAAARKAAPPKKEAAHAAV